jgi:hypothetical protein
MVLRRSEDVALGVPHSDRLDRDAALLLQVDAELAQDRHRAAPDRDGSTDLPELVGRFEDLDRGGVSTDTSETKCVQTCRDIRKRPEHHGSREPTDASTDNDDLETRSRHSR